MLEILDMLEWLAPLALAGLAALGAVSPRTSSPPAAARRSSELR